MPTEAADPVPTIIPQLIYNRYQKMIADLPTTLCGTPDRARAALQQIFGEIRLVPEENEVWADVSAFGRDQILKW